MRLSSYCTEKWCIFQVQGSIGKDQKGCVYERTNIDSCEALEKFLPKTEKLGV